MMDGFAGIWIILILSAATNYCSAVVINPLTSKPCLPEIRLDNQSSCLRRITDALFNETEFFFGRNLDALCDKTQQDNQDNVNCYIGDENGRQYSLASRLLSGNIKSDGTDRYLKIVFTSSNGSYSACGGTYHVEKRLIDANPDMSPALPVNVRNMPTFEMRADKNIYYTIIAMDATYKFIHGLFVDYPQMRVIIPYKTPYNFRNFTNAFVFLVYRQTDRDYMLDPRTMHLMNNTALVKEFTLEQFAADHGLVGPVAINWMLVGRDPWAVQQVANRGFDSNYCVTLVNEAVRTSGVGFMDKYFATIDTLLTLTYSSLSVSFNVCCHNYTISSPQVSVNALGNQAVDAVLLRIQPQIAANRTIVRSTIETRQYTLMAVDVDLSGQFSSISKPFLLWLTINVNEAEDHPLDVSKSLFPYLEPLPSQLLEQSRKIYFLLFEQSMTTPVHTTTISSSGDVCLKEYAGRCQFPVEDFIQQNKLTLRAANWLTINKDAYSKFALIRNGGEQENNACLSEPKYTSLCFSGPAKTGQERGPVGVPTTTPKSGCQLFTPSFVLAFLSTVFLNFS